MLRYILKRIGLMFLTLIIITFIVFAMIRLMPDIKEVSFGEDPDLKKIFIEREGLDKPIITQFFIWIKNIFTRFDFGYSKLGAESAIKHLGRKLPISMRINIIPYLISIPIGFAFGIWAALKKNKVTDHFISTIVMVFISVPSFVVATVMQYTFAYRIRLFEPLVAPSQTLINGVITKTPFHTMFLSLIMPTMALCFGSIAGLTRLSRAELTEVLTSEFMLLCRTKGLSKRQATVRHALRNSLVPIVPSLIGGFVSILSGSLVIERIFRIPGIGGVYLDAFSARDYNLVMVLMLFYTFIGLLTTLIIDVSYGLVDPRIRMGGRK